MATLGWTVGIQRHPDEPVVFIHCQDVKKLTPPGGMQSWLTIPPTGGTPAVPMLGDSTVAQTSRDSPSVTALPPDEGVEMADVDSEWNEQSMLQYRGSIRTSTHSEGGRSSLRTGSADPPAILFASPVVRIDDTSVLHPYFPHKSDTGPIRLLTIAHVFNYRMAVLRNGIKSAVRVARERKAEVCFLLNSDIQWGQQVAAMFQIISTMVVELPSFQEELEEISGMPLNIQLISEPWGHDNHEDTECECQSSDQTAVYVHDLSVDKRELEDSPDTDMALSILPESGIKGHRD